MGALTTHILDLTRGKPAAHVRIDCYACDGASLRFLGSSMTNRDGRPDVPLIRSLKKGRYELHVHIGSYFGIEPDQTFLDVLTIRFTVSDPDQNFHVPLLVSPYGYQVYRGS
ncbi:hydroxyisourate hydrolase [Sporolactobacillus sp. THM19-2]|uniref:hydroxyisourate hydrolase n=1 Tax=Sporolactobacillus sp. THM19-2 TaxID=2511171 RepID=UPI00101F3FC5|nr:hydroxyisourate hydrolase [Sporolactobacillus sp. THM19-2]RYL88542.1 hydroxyisourate hydrolase [Sporolactobacillus sp. THM19-2]